MLVLLCLLRSFYMAGKSDTAQPVLVIVGRSEPIYECVFDDQGDVASCSHQFVVHAALDIVDELLPQGNAVYLKTVDRYRELLVSAYVTPGHVRFMLLHDGKSEDTVRNFFEDVYEMYLKVLLNPFYRPNSAIESPDFDMRVRALGKRYLQV